MTTTEQCSAIINSDFHHLEVVVMHVLEAIKISKELQADLRELESCGYDEPDSRFQASLSAYNQHVEGAEQLMSICSYNVVDKVLPLCGWAIMGDGIEGDCWDLKHEEV